MDWLIIIILVAAIIFTIILIGPLLLSLLFIAALTLLGAILMLIGVLGPILLGLGATVKAIIRRVRGNKEKGVHTTQSSGLLNVVESLYARGKISKEEYDQFNEHLS